jgi:transposase
VNERKAYPSDVSDEEWAFVAPYLTLMTEDALQREYPLREVFNGLRYLVRGGTPWRMMPNDLPPWHTVYQQTQRWLKAGVFEAMVHDLRGLRRLGEGRKGEPSAAIFDIREAAQQQPWRAPGSGQTARRQKGLRLAAAPLGRRAQFQLDGALPPSGA